jgi:hypothetical protein
MLLRPGGHDVLAPRRGAWAPRGGVFHEEPVVAPMSPLMRSASLNASRSCPGVPAAPWWEGLAALDAHAGGRRSGLASLERDPDAGRDREQEWPVTAVLVEPAVGEFPDLSAPGLLELGRRSQLSSGTRSSGFRPGGGMRRRWHRELRPHPLSPARRGRVPLCVRPDLGATARPAEAFPANDWQMPSTAPTNFATSHPADREDRACPGRPAHSLAR